MLGDPAGGERAAALDRAERVRAAKRLFGEDGGAEMTVGDHALGQVVQTLEALPARDRELAGGEEMLERALLRLPAPHRAALALERAHRQRPLLGDARDHAALDLAAFGRALPAPPVVVAQCEHPPLEQRIVLDRE